MPDTAQAKILDAYKALVEGYAPLAGKSVITDRSPEEAIEDAELPAIVIYFEAWDFRDAPELGQSMELHTALINFDVIETSANVGFVSRRNAETIAHINAAVQTDPVLGGRIEDFRGMNVAPPMDNGKSVGGASLQAAIRFYTPLRDHFTIVGIGGETF